MAEFKISTLRYTWKGDWQTGTDYIKDDVVKYGSSSWICIRKHTSSAFNDDFTFVPEGESLAQPAWLRMTSGYRWRSDWTASTLYEPGDLVLQGGIIYHCTDSHTSSSTFDADIANWIVYSSAIDWTYNWQADTRYGVGDVVKWGSTIYRCSQGHTSDSTALENDIANWSAYLLVKDYAGEWTQGARYKENDLIKFGGSLLRCTVGHLAGVNIDNTNFTVEMPGSKIKGEWSSLVYYAAGDVVQHGGYIYQARINTYNETPGESIYQPHNPSWTIIYKGVRLVGEWSADATYKTGDVVQRGGYTYVALLDTTDDGSSLDYLDAGNWELLVPTQAWKSSWTVGNTYSLNDVVTYRGTAYRCIVEHVAIEESFPGDNGNGFDYFEILLQGTDKSGLVGPGDLLTYGLSRSFAGDGSTIGETNIPLGAEEGILQVDADDTFKYDRFGSSNRFIYVNQYDGVDATTDNRGLDPFRPYRTVRFACEQVENDGFTGNTTIQVATGSYEEILPIRVPANVVILGDELRGTTIKPKGSITELIGDIAYRPTAMSYLTTVIDKVILNQAHTKLTGNTENQVFLIDTEVVGTDPNGNEITQQVPIFGDQEGVNIVDAALADYVQYINFYVGGSGTAPDVDGTNTESTADNIVNAGRAIKANKAFLAAEYIAYITLNYPSYALDTDIATSHIYRLIDALDYDLKRTGNYQTLREAEYYRNSVNGSSLQDMFYLRNATGVRNCTLTGLSGTLNPQGVFEEYRRPTGGAYCSLDPGWGPDDQRTWITTRSPYIQNVSTFGENCIGQKIDGSLHNGGNKSFVSNDFTQLIDNGIGAWVLNNGRAELVSVFTYYAQVGYLAESGGIIRGTNGNCSYGFIGALADGTDPSETPIQAKVNTRLEQAIISSAFAGEVNDEILALEFKNAGQNYTTANYTFVGSGTQADVVQEDFRYDAIFDPRIVTGSNSAAAGGGGYTLIGNQAQTGGLTSITLASNDENEESNLLGLRIFITSGEGTGQYGYVGGYNPTTKVLDVLRESDDQPGWDHVIPGYEIRGLLTTSTTYRFEPRVIVSDPDYDAFDTTLDAGTVYTDITFGETSGQFNNVTGQPGTGDVIRDDGLVPVTATFDITKDGSTYDVVIRNPGAGYIVGDEIVIRGDDLGGTTPANDLTITVTETSDDSTDIITDFTVSGNAESGRYVAVSNIGTTVNYSADGITWTTGALPSSDDWACVAAGKADDAGEHRFVTIKANSNIMAWSRDGESWFQRTVPVSANWSSVTFGKGIFVAVAKDGNYAMISDNGIQWTMQNIPDSPYDDSTINTWEDVTFGKDRFVAVSSSNNLAAVGEYVGGTLTWTTYIMDATDDSSLKDWASVAYANNRFVAIEPTGRAAYSFDGETWVGTDLPSPDGSSFLNWNRIRSGNGIFIATADAGDNPTIGADPITNSAIDYIYQSQDGIKWVQKMLPTESKYDALVCGFPNLDSNNPADRTGQWVILSQNITTTAQRVLTGATAFLRAVVGAGQISQLNIFDPGSGYRTNPTYTLIDPNNTGDAVFDTSRIADRVLGQPSWLNRGVGYKTSTTSVTLLGDGFADIVPVGKFINVSEMPILIGPGAQLRIAGNDTLYTVVVIERESTQSDGTFTFNFRVSPELEIEDDIFHNQGVTINTRYSQCRITNHDFLDIGTGGFTDTNYPNLYTGNYLSYPENEVIEKNGGRVFYTSTDQSGNFRCGELFSVEQATGIVTISADFFDLGGLTELALGGIRVGGTGTVIREFSTDPLFIEDSNNIVPTQRAIKAYLANRLNIGGADLLTASFIAGTVKVGPNQITNTAGLGVNFAKIADFKGPKAGVKGAMLAQNFFFRSFKDRD
jgi:hypothetical protein